MKQTELSLATINGGALEEAIATELRRICSNIQDPNTKATAKRKLTVSIVFAPDERRGATKIRADVKSVLASQEAQESAAFIARVAGTEDFTLIQDSAQQPPLFEPEQTEAQVPALRSGTMG